MNAIINSFFIVSPFVITFLAAILFVIFATLTLAKPRLLAYPYLAVLFLISGNTFGNLDATVPVYNRGAGLFYFALILWLVLIAYVWSRVAAAFSKTSALPCNLYPWFLGWFLLLAAHCTAAVFLKIPITDAISPSGFSNVIWMASLILLLLSAFTTQEQTEEFTRMILLVGLGRAVYGLVRLIAFGGDPANAYANFHRVDVKLTFFDLNDSLVCMLAFSVAAIQLFRSGSINQSRMWQIICWLTILATTACIVLSFRRTAWLGFLLGGLVVLSQLPSKRRIQAAIFGGPIIVLAIVRTAWNRLSQTKGAGGLESFFYDIKTKNVGAESERLLELKLAWADFMDHPIFGIGSWGGYTGHHLISWQTLEAGRYLHSGVLHVALKTGLIGLTLLVGLYATYFLFVRRSVRTVSDANLPLFIAGVAGAAFMLPDMVIGTPIPQIRTTQMLALCFALPYLAHGISQRFSFEGAKRVLKKRSYFGSYGPSPASTTARFSQGS